MARTNPIEVAKPKFCLLDLSDQHFFVCVPKGSTGFFSLLLEDLHVRSCEYLANMILV